MKPRSAKNKGRRLQNEVRDVLRERLAKYGLEDDDIKSAIMGESGEDHKLSPAARRLFPYSTECKNQEKLSIWSALKQAEDNSRPDTEPLLIFTRNRAKTYVTMQADHFYDLIEEQIRIRLLLENK